MWSVIIGSKWRVELGSPCQFEAVSMKIRHATQCKARWVGGCGVGFLPKGNREPIQWRTITGFWLEVDLGGGRWVIFMLHCLHVFIIFRTIKGWFPVWCGGEEWRQMEFWWYDIYGAFTLDVKSVLNENLDGILGGA